MNKVCVNDMKIELEKLETNLDEYNDLYLTIFHELSIALENWKDNRSLQFSEDLYLEKQQTKKFIESLKDRRDIYKYIVTEYSKIGNIISFNLSKKSSFDQKTTAVKNALNAAIRQGENAAYSIGHYRVSEAGYFVQEKRKINDMIKQIDSIKTQVDSILSEIGLIESNVKKKIDKLEYKRITSYTPIKFN